MISLLCQTLLHHHRSTVQATLTVYKERAATAAAHMFSAVTLLDTMYHCRLNIMQIHQMLYLVSHLLIHANHLVDR